MVPDTLCGGYILPIPQSRGWSPVNLGGLQMPHTLMRWDRCSTHPGHSNLSSWPHTLPLNWGKRVWGQTSSELSHFWGPRLKLPKRPQLPCRGPHDLVGLPSREAGSCRGSVPLIMWTWEGRSAPVTQFPHPWMEIIFSTLIWLLSFKWRWISERGITLKRVQLCALQVTLVICKWNYVKL